MRKIVFMFIVACWAVSKCQAQDTLTLRAPKIRDIPGYLSYDNEPNLFFVLPADSLVYSQKEKIFYFTDRFGKWLIWHYDSDTLELIQPKINFIKMGKKIINLNAR